MKISTLRTLCLAVLTACFLCVGCAHYEKREMDTTAYCGCGKCCGWHRGSWKYLKLNVWSRYVSEGAQAGKKYSGRTASGKKPHQYHPGLVSMDTFAHPWTFPVRLLFPWLWFEQYGTLAADTRYHPFGTEMFISGYGWGEVLDRGGAIKGPTRIDIYFDSHREALKWGRKRVTVDYKPRK